jgi:hypothetical protein
VLKYRSIKSVQLLTVKVGKWERTFGHFGPWLKVPRPLRIAWNRYVLRAWFYIKCRTWGVVAAWYIDQYKRRVYAQLSALPCEGKHSTSVVHGSTCELCEPLYEKLYPQGWHYYPGDVCIHGVYVGGCGVDYMCAACEGGF